MGERLEGRDINSFDKKALKKALKAEEDKKTRKDSELDDRKR